MKFSNWLALSFLVASGLLLWSLREIIIQIFAGIVIAMAFCTLVEKIRSHLPVHRLIALIIALSSLLLILSLTVIIVVPPFTKEFQELILQLPNAARTLWEIAVGGINSLTDKIYGENAGQILSEKLITSGITNLPDGSTLASGVGDGIKKLLGLAGNLGSGFVQIIFILAVSLMISVQPNAYREVAILLIPAFYRKRAQSILRKCGDSLSDWMVGVLISSLCVAILAGVGLSILGVKLVIANALLAGMLNIIPNVGPVISTIFPMSVALLDEPWKAIAVLGMYIVIQNLESYLITPSIMQHQVKLLPGLTLIAQFIFTVIFGPIGLILALPLAVVLQVLVKEIIIHDLLDPWKKQRLAR